MGAVNAPRLNDANQLHPGPAAPATDDRAAIIALNDLGAAAFLCNGIGRVLATSAAAEALLRSGRSLVRRQGMIAAAAPQSNRDLMGAIRRAAASDTPVNSTVLITTDADRSHIAVDVVALPHLSPDRDHDGAGIVLVLLGGGSRPCSADHLLKMGLSAAEVQVARGVALGFGATELAAQRSVGRETIKSQLKAIYRKLAVSGQRELADRLRGLA